MAVAPGSWSVLNVDQAGGDPAAQHAFGGMRHGGSGFARADYVDVGIPREVPAFQVTGYGGGWIGGGQRGFKNGQRMAAQKLDAHGSAAHGSAAHLINS